MTIHRILSRLSNRWHRGNASRNPVQTARRRRMLIEPLESRKVLTTIDLDGAFFGLVGKKIYGADASDLSGWSVSGAGDFNGDGYDDLIIGAIDAAGLTNTNNDAGESYLIFGPTPSAGTVDLDNLGAAGIRIVGIDANDRSGWSVSGAGDVNGDGYDDLVIGATLADGPGNANIDSGESYVIFGEASPSAVIDLNNLTGIGVKVLSVDAGDRTGFSVSGAGDINGDGFDDMIIGAPYADAVGNAKNSAGEIYVIFGATSFPTTIDLANLGSAGITIFGADSTDITGRSVSSAGDVNSDGFDDLIIGASSSRSLGNARNLAGESHIVFGKADWSLSLTIDLANLGTSGTTIFGIDNVDRSGTSVSSAGDVNGDGYDDLIIGAKEANASGNLKPNAGESYVVYGMEFMPATIDLTTLGTAGITIFGADADDQSGFSVSNAGDINADGYDDLIIGAREANASGNGKSNAGESYVVFGSAAMPITINLATLGSAGITIFGADVDDRAGHSVSGAGDVNGDGFDDLLIGAPLASAAGNSKLGAGESYLIFGGNSFTNSILPANLGTNALNIIVGNTGDQIINGADGNDLIVGNGGADVLIGGRGNDVLAVGDLDFRRVRGGNGFDTLRVDGTGLTLNLTHNPDHRQVDVEDVEQIDLGSGKDHVVRLTAHGLRSFSTHSNTLTINGSGSQVRFMDGVWSGPTLVDGNTYRQYTKGSAIVKIRTTLTERVASIPLATLNGTNGFRIDGIAAYDSSGYSVSSAGDFNGDGYDDLVIGAWSSDASSTDSGQGYVVFGKSGGFTSDLDLSSLNGSNGFRMDGIDAGDHFGNAVSSAGDINGDGFDDLILGARWADAGASESGEAYVVLGKSSGFGPTLNLSTLDGSNGFRLNGIDATDYSGWSVSGAGDINGDGADDLIIGAVFGDAGASESGESYVVFGTTSGFAASISLASLNGTNGFRLDGIVAGDGVGRSVSSAGDFNGDGYGDLLIGAASGNGGLIDTGESYMVFGKPNGFTPTFSLSSLDGSNGLRFTGVATNDQSGWSVSGAGDVNGDGFDDIIIGARYEGVVNNGASYVVFGHSSGFTASMSLSSLNGINGFRLIGTDGFDSSGVSVSGAGDVNGDGFDDLIIGAYKSESDSGPSNSGEAYVIFGKSSGFSSSLSLANIDGNSRFRLEGIDANDLAGRSVSDAGDLNGDGFDDLIIGAYQGDAGASNSGESYVVFGRNFTGGVETQIGTSGDNTLHSNQGSSAVDILIGGRGNDSLYSDGGSDVLIGGQGDDALFITNLDFSSNRRLSGGSGTDTLILQGSGHTFDLSNIRDNRIQDIERIDITGTGGNTLILNPLEVLNLSSTTNTLLVRRNFGDTVNIGSGWTLGVDQFINSVRYQTFTQGLATLLIEVPTLVGTNGTDVFVLTYGSTSNTGNVSVSKSTNGDPTEFLGTLPMNVPLILDALAGTDSVRIEGTSGSDTMEVTSAGLNINGHNLYLEGVEARTLAGDDNNDTYRFDADAALGTWAFDESVGGSDTIDLGLTTTQSVTLNLGLATPQTINTNLTLSLGSAQDFESAIGGSQADTLTGNAFENILTGGPGNDTLNGLGGNDHLFGGLDNDTYIFDSPTSLEADDVNELANQGTDTLSFAAISTTVNLNLASLAIQPVHTNRTLKLSSQTTFENIVGGSAADTLTGNVLHNVLTGGPGNDTLVGAAGNDTLIGGLNDDTYIFGTATAAESDSVQEQPGEGTDSLSFSTLQTAIILDLASIAAQPVHTNRVLQLNSATAFENAIGGKGGDTLTGNSLNNVLTGGQGADILNGAAGNDTLIGGLQNDTYVFTTASSPEADEVQEAAGQGLDTLSFASLATGVTLNLGSLAVQPVHTNRTLKLNAQTTFENIIGGSAADTLTGNILNNSLTGNAGDDVLVGGAGSDTLFGGLDNDTYIFAAATAPESDFLIESVGQGTDTISFASLTTDVSLNLASSLDQAVHLNRMLRLNSGGSFENVTSGSGNDVLLGNNLNNSFNGGNGNNILVGSGGADTLTGGNGRDILIGGLGLDTIGGGSGEDLLIAGRTLSDTNVANLLTVRNEWASANAYATRINNLRAGVGVPLVSLIAQTNVLNDAGEDDVLTGGAGADWYFRAVDDAIADLFAGEVIDLL